MHKDLLPFKDVLTAIIELFTHKDTLAAAIKLAGKELTANELTEATKMLKDNFKINLIATVDNPDMLIRFKSLVLTYMPIVDTPMAEAMFTSINIPQQELEQLTAEVFDYNLNNCIN